jgi:single-strand DNA-binding protein
MIQLTLIGNIGNDAVTKQVNGKDVTEFSFACKTGTKKEDKPTWVKCAIWGDRGKSAAQYLTKGTSLVVFGSLSKNEVYTNKQNETVATLNVMVDKFSFTGGKSEPANATSEPQAGYATTPASDDDLPF